MAVTKAKKEEVLQELIKKFGDSKGVVFAQYRGLGVMDAQALRRGLREANVDYKVAKKTLIRLAAKENGVEIPENLLEGPVGVAFGYEDQVSAAQKMAHFSKEFEDRFELCGGVMEGKVVNANVVKQLASIPPRDVLLAKFMGSAMSPLSGFVGLSNGLLSAFARVVDGYREKREESNDAPAAEEPTKEENSSPEEAPATEEASE